MGAEAHEDVWAALRNPAVVHGMCEDYRAGLTIDVEHDRADRAAGRRVRCPVQSVWATRDDPDLFGPTPSPSCAAGPTTCAAPASTAATTWPRRRRRRPPRRCRPSGPRSAGRRRPFDVTIERGTSSVGMNEIVIRRCAGRARVGGAQPQVRVRTDRDRAQRAARLVLPSGDGHRAAVSFVVGDRGITPHRRGARPGEAASPLKCWLLALGAPIGERRRARRR